MKIITKQALMLIFGLALLQPHIITAKKCNDLIILLDPHLNEKIDGKSSAIAMQFIDNLYEKACPMIVSTNIVHNFCFWKKEYKQDLEAIKQEALKSKSLDMAKTKANNLFSQKKDLVEKSGLFWMLISGADLLSNDWHCYIHKQADLVLLIPKNYITQRAPHILSNIEAQIEACGIKTTDLDKINNTSSESVLNHIQAKKNSSPINIIDGVKSIFITKQPSDEMEDIPAWNFYLCGHGGPTRTKAVLEEEYTTKTTEVEQITTMMQQLEKMKSMGAKIGDEQMNMARTMAEQSKKNNNTLLAIIQSANNLSGNAIVPQSGIIAGVSLTDFSRLLTFVNSSIKTNFIHYATCFGGGYNQTFVNDELQKLNVNFILAAEGTNEASIIASMSAPIIDKNNQLMISSMKFINYFGLLENFFGEPTKIIGMQAPQGWQKDPLAAIEGTLVPLSQLGTNQPFVRIPSAGVFTALNVDKKVKILTHSIVKAHESENRTIDCANPEITIIFVYPKYIQVPLKITKNQAFMSPTPQTIDQLYQTTHIFEEIISDQPLSHIIFNFIKLNSSYSRLTFIIKKLICTEKSPVENIVIQVTGKFSGEKIISSINALYTINGITKHLIIPSAQLGREISEFIKSWNNTSFNIITPKEVTTNALQLLEETDKKELEGESITLADVVAQYEKKINKDFGVQKPGALKKVLLLKQLQGLAIATTQETLLEQLEWLKQKGKPTQQFIASLNNQKTELNKLANDFKQMVATKSIDQKEYADVENKIKTIDASLNEILNKIQPTQVIAQPSKLPAPIITQPATIQPTKLPTQAPAAQPAQPIAAQSAKLSPQEERDLRQAIVDYKKNRSRTNAEQTIYKYANKFPNDPLVKSKLNEKAKFDASEGIKPSIATQSPAQQSVQPAKSPAQPTKPMVQPSIIQPAKLPAQPAQPIAIPSAKLSAQEERDLRQAVVDYKKNRSRASAEQTIYKYANKFPNDPLVKSKLNEKNKFDASEGIKSKK